MDDINKIADLVPEFSEKVDAFKLKLLEVTGFEWIVIQGRRTIEEQDGIFAQGRTTKGPGVDADHPLGHTVSNAKGGQSPHNFGYAVDMVPIGFTQNGGQLWWGAPESLWKQYADLAQEMGLTAGYYFHSIHDPDHVEDEAWHQAQADWKSGIIAVA